MGIPKLSGLGEVHHSRGQLHALPNKDDFQEVRSPISFARFPFASADFAIRTTKCMTLCMHDPLLGLSIFPSACRMHRS